MIAAADERGDPRMLTNIGLFLLPSQVNPNAANLDNLVMSVAPFVAVGAQPQISSHAVHGRPAQARRGVGGDPARRPARRPTTGAPPKASQTRRPVDKAKPVQQNWDGAGTSEGVRNFREEPVTIPEGHVMSPVIFRFQRSQRLIQARLLVLSVPSS